MHMTYYCQQNPDGTIHVTNQVGPHTGQHHVHTQAGFDRWAADVSKSAIDWATLRTCNPCDCTRQVDLYPKET